MTTINLANIQHLAARYIWWQTPEQALAQPERLIAQIMNIGDYYDVQTLVAHIDKSVLCNVLTNAQPGQFNHRSWHYWHYRLGLTAIGASVPTIPMRTFQ